MSIDTKAGSDYWIWVQTQHLTPTNQVDNFDEAVAFALAAANDSIERGYLEAPLNNNLIAFLRDLFPGNGSHAALNSLVPKVKLLLDDGKELDPGWLELLEYSNNEVEWIPMALDNAIALGRPLHPDILDWYDDKVPTADKQKPTIEYLKESLSVLLRSNLPYLNWWDPAGYRFDHSATLDMLYLKDRAAAIGVAQDFLRQSIARNEPFDVDIWANMKAWDSTAALNLADEKLRKSISRNEPLQATLFNDLAAMGPAEAAAVLEAKIRDAIQRGGSETASILTDQAVTPPKTRLMDAIDKLAMLDASARDRMAVLYLQDLITRKGPLAADDPPLLAELEVSNPAAYASILVKSLRASNARNEFDEARIDALKALNPADAAGLTLEFLQLTLARGSKVDTAVLDKLAVFDQRAAEQFSKAALADALSRGIRIATSLEVPLPAAPATDTGSFTLTLQALNKWSPAAAAEWAASFNLLAEGKPVADIKAAFTEDQKATQASWISVMQKLLSTDDNAGDAVGRQIDLDIDLETALQLVFLGRAQQLEKQLRDQIESVQAKNELMGLMNDALGVLNKVQELVASDAKATDKIKDKTGGKLTPALITEVTNSLKAAGITPFTAGFSGELTKGELAGAIQQIKAQIDSLGNNQQTEMIRLQSLTTKRNECYEIITNQMSKMASINEKVMSNMR